jgi:hypothetical protein
MKKTLKNHQQVKILILNSYYSLAFAGISILQTFKNCYHNFCLNLYLDNKNIKIIYFKQKSSILNLVFQLKKLQ